MATIREIFFLLFLGPTTLRYYRVVYASISHYLLSVASTCIRTYRGVRNELKTCTRFLDFSLISVVLCGWIKALPLGFLDFSQAVVRDFSCVSDPSGRIYKKLIFNYDAVCICVLKDIFIRNYFLTMMLYVSVYMLSFNFMC